MDIAKLTKGSILSETSFYKVESVNNNGITVKDEHNNTIDIGKEYVEKILISADQYSSEEKKTMTELSELFINSPRIAMTVAFYKKDIDKTKKAYNAEVAAAIAKVQNAKVSEVDALLKDLIENPVSKTIPGEFRVMKGRHNGFMNGLGRIDFMDMEDTKGFMKQVDPRTIEYIIVNDVKYSLK